MGEEASVAAEAPARAQRPRWLPPSWVALTVIGGAKPYYVRADEVAAVVPGHAVGALVFSRGVEEPTHVAEVPAEVFAAMNSATW